MNWFRHPIVQVVLLAVTVGLVFHPAITAEYSLIDDASVVADLSKSQASLSLVDIFFPSVSNGGYYRPLLALSQHLDKILWGLDSRITHLENILLHLWNVIWVYLLARQAVGQSHMTPLIAALIFAVHPLTTESVCWYSGRTDLLAGTFTLPSVWLVTRWQSQSHKEPWLLVGAMGLFMLGVLSKESALAFLLALPLLVTVRQTVASDSEGARTGRLRFPDWYWYFLACNLMASLITALFFFKFLPSVFMLMICLIVGRCLLVSHADHFYGVIKSLSWWVSVCLLVPIIFLSLRKIAFTSSIPRIHQTITLITQDIDYAVGLFMGGLGFYVKKFFFPLPLNFAIREIDPLFQLFGIVILYIALVLLLYNTTVSRYALIGGVLLVPALPFVLGTIAWTSYAERYVYLSAVFWSVAIAASWHRFLFQRIALTGCIVFFAIISFQRAVLWQTNVGLLSDTVYNSPKFKYIRAYYMYALFLKGNLEEAEKQYLHAKSMPSVDYIPLIDFTYANILYKKGDRERALKLLDEISERSKGALQDVSSLKDEILNSAGTYSIGFDR